MCIIHNSKQDQTPGWDNSATKVKGINEFWKSWNFQRGRDIFQESEGVLAKTWKLQCTKDIKQLDWHRESVLVNNSKKRVLALWVGIAGGPYQGYRV